MRANSDFWAGFDIFLTSLTGLLVEGMDGMGGATTVALEINHSLYIKSSQENEVCWLFWRACFGPSWTTFVVRSHLVSCNTYLEPENPLLTYDPLHNVSTVVNYQCNNCCSPTRARRAGLTFLGWVWQMLWSGAILCSGNPPWALKALHLTI